MKLLLIVLAITICSCSCNTMGELMPMYEQEISKDRILCQSGTCLVTYVWNDGDIVKSWFDDIDNPKIDSIKEVRKKEANQLIKLIKSLK